MDDLFNRRHPSFLQFAKQHLVVVFDLECSSGAEVLRNAVQEPNGQKDGHFVFGKLLVPRRFRDSKHVQYGIAKKHEWYGEHLNRLHCLRKDQRAILRRVEAAVHVPN